MDSNRDLDRLVLFLAPLGIMIVSEGVAWMLTVLKPGNNIYNWLWAF